MNPEPIDPDIQQIADLLQNAEGSVTPPVAGFPGENSESEKKQQKLHLLTRALSGMEDSFWAFESEEIPDLDDQVQEVLKKTIFIRKRGWRDPFQKWLPAAAVFLVLINTWVLLQRYPGVVSPTESGNRVISQRTDSFSGSPSSSFIRPASTNVMSQSPMLHNPWEEGQPVVVEIASRPVRKVIRTRKKWMQWEETGLEPLERGQSVQVRFFFGDSPTSNSEKVERPVYVMSEPQAKLITARLSEAGSDFEKAQVYYDNQCFYEALYYMSCWKEDHPSCLDTLGVLKKCYEKMGFQKQANQVELRMQEIRSELSQNSDSAPSM